MITLLVAALLLWIVEIPVIPFLVAVGLFAAFYRSTGGR